MEISRPEKIYFEDDGVTPNNKLPVLVYRTVFKNTSKGCAQHFEQKFQENNLIGNWRDIVLTEDHYHSTTHEVLGVSRGSVRLHLGGKKGKVLEVSAGDVLVIPAGVAHRSLSNDHDYEVIGGYPDGLSWDMIFCESKKYSQAKKKIELLDLPATDPLFGENGPLLFLWN